jgi:predicted dehydrogenase
VRGEYLQDWLLSAEDSNWRVDDNLGGPSRAFADIGIHICDLIEFVTGEEIVNLVSKLQTVYQHRQGKKVLNEDTAAIIAQLQGGAIVSLMISQVAAGHKNGLVLEVDGSQKALRFEQENPELLWVGSSSESTILNRDPRNLSPDAQRLTKLPAGHPEGYFDAFVSFMRDVELAIQGGEPFGLPSFRDGVRSSVLTNAVIASSKTNRWVPII